jgi:uncharacterized coiled-coil protein SlyX
MFGRKKLEARLAALENTQGAVLGALQQISGSVSALAATPRHESEVVPLLAPVLASLQQQAEAAPQAYKMLVEMVNEISNNQIRGAASAFGRVGGRRARIKAKALADELREKERQLEAMYSACAECAEVGRGVPFDQRVAVSGEVGHMHLVMGHDAQLQALTDRIAEIRKTLGGRVGTVPGRVRGQANGAVVE